MAGICFEIHAGIGHDMWSWFKEIIKLDLVEKKRLEKLRCQQRHQAKQENQTASEPMEKSIRRKVHTLN
jgi:hypothetical protein